MPISSWDAAYYLGALLDVEVAKTTEIAAGLIPKEYHSDIRVFVAESANGLDKKSLLTGAMVASIIRDRVTFIPGGDDEVVTCVICGNHKPVPATSDDEFGWVCLDCERIYSRILEIERMKAIRIDEDEMRAKHGYSEQEE